MVAAKRYWNIFRHKPSGRADRRVLNRTVSCSLCGGALGTDRWLYRAYTSHMAFDLIAAHTGCPGEYLRQRQAQREAENAQRAVRSARWAAEQSARSRLIVVDFAPPSLLLAPGTAQGPSSTRRPGLRG